MVTAWVRGAQALALLHPINWIHYFWMRCCLDGCA